MKKRSGIRKLILLGAGAWILGLPHISAAAPDSDVDGTMLMFVGEELEVVTVASRFPESPSNAPAIVRVVDHEEMEKRGFHTLAEILASEPGFFISRQAQGSVPYLRGISNGILVLYDGVPIPRGANRSYYPLDDELSLNSVKQVEIIRGPGSVLWGADAFAGIVNVVPFSGKDAGVNQVRVFTGSDTPVKGFGSMGYQGRSWDAYLSVYGAKKDMVDNSPDSEGDGTKILENSDIGDSEYYEVTANLNLNDCFSFSGRFSDFNRTYSRYAFQEHAGAFENSDVSVWASEKKAPVNYVKMNYSKVSGRSHWNATTYYQNLTLKKKNHASSFEESTDIFYGELLWDRRLFKKGLVTAGLSYRENRVQDAVVEGSNFIPGYLGSKFEFYDQSLNSKQKDYKNSLNSFFAQYRHPFAWGELWAGCRLDDNSMYEDNAVSYNFGVNVPLGTAWRLKTVFGTAYRTPYSYQLVEDKLLERDEVSTVNLQLEWNPDRDTRFSITAYHSSLSDNVQPDPYAVISEPSDQDFAGLELCFNKNFNDKLNWFFSMSRLFSYGDPYSLKARSHRSYENPHKPVIEYHPWEEEYDLGPDFTLNSGVIWHLNEKVQLSLNACWSSPIPYSYNQNEITGEYKNPVLLNGEVRVMELLENLELKVGCKNLLNGEFEYPGFYGPVEGEPLNIYTSIIYRF